MCPGASTLPLLLSDLLPTPPIHPRHQSSYSASPGCAAISPEASQIPQLVTTVRFQRSSLSMAKHPFTGEIFVWSLPRSKQPLARGWGHAEEENRRCPYPRGNGHNRASKYTSDPTSEGGQQHGREAWGSGYHQGHKGHQDVRARSWRESRTWRRRC